MSYNVWDARNGNTTGPYSKADAEQMAADLNAMVYRNTFGSVFGGMAVKVTGPFYVRPAKIDGLAFGGEEVSPALTAAAVAGAALCVGLVGWLVWGSNPAPVAKPVAKPAMPAPVAAKVTPAPAPGPTPAQPLAPPPAPMQQSAPVPSAPQDVPTGLGDTGSPSASAPTTGVDDGFGID